METASTKQLNFKSLPTQTVKAFEFLSQQKWLEKSNWYLAGGTALALQVGNRKSVDLDFFTTDKEFNVKNLLRNFSGYKDWKVTMEEDSTLYGEIFNAKVSFIAYPFFVPKNDFIQCGSINILQPADIAIMKIIAVSQRGKKRDFFDLYWCAKNIEPLDSLIKRLKEQYPSVAHDYHHILKSLVYFEDAESDPEPEIYFKASWQEIKDFFEREIPRITRDLIGLN